jgi:HSP20 family protein
MAMVKWDPWREMEDLFNRYSRLSGPSTNRGEETMTPAEWAPRADIMEDENRFLITLEIPGIAKEDIKVSVDRGVLSISGERKQEKEEKGRTYHRTERFYGTFSRSFTLPDAIDSENIKASFNDGLLNLELPKTPKAKPKEIDIKID